MKPKLYLAALVGLLFYQSAFAQKKEIRPLQEGDKMLALEVNGIFDYVGNLFNSTEYNHLNIPSSGFVYRKFNTDNKATRYRAAFGFDRYNTTIIAAPNFTEQIYTTAFLNLAYGREYRKQVNRWSVYAGADLNVLHRFNAMKLEANKPFSETHSIDGATRVERNQSHRTFFGAVAFAGAEYFFGDAFCIGVELNAPLLIGLNYGRSQDIATVDRNAEGALITTNETQNLNQQWLVTVNNTTPVIFRAGLRF